MNPSAASSSSLPAAYAGATVRRPSRCVGHGELEEPAGALSHAGTVALLMTKELENSQVALRDLATP